MKVSRAERCLFHPMREAVARCPECTRFFCRECISEHDDRVLCASCLARGGRAETQSRSRFGQALPIAAALLGLFTAWWFFDLLGSGLTRLPASVHEGTVWQTMDNDE